MVVMAIWDTWSSETQPVFSVGHDQKDAFNRNPRRKEFAGDERGQFHIMVFASEKVEI